MTLTGPNVMVHEMKGTNGGKDSTCIREFFGDRMVATCKVDDVETVRTYAAVWSQDEDLEILHFRIFIRCLYFRNK